MVVSLGGVTKLVVKEACSQGLVIKDQVIYPPAVRSCALRNKVFVHYLAVLLKTCAILLTVGSGAPLRFYNAKTRSLILLREIPGRLAPVFIENQHKTWGF